MIRIALLLALAAILSGCASLTYPLPKCDGYKRRPLNRSMWPWEEDGNLQQKRADMSLPAPGRLTAAYVEERTRPPAFAQFDFAGSYRNCEG